MLRRSPAPISRSTAAGPRSRARYLARHKLTRPSINEELFRWIAGLSPAMTALAVLPECEHVQPEPLAHDVEQQHCLEDKRDRGSDRSPMAAVARHQRDAEHDIHHKRQAVSQRAGVLVAEHV